MLAIKHGPQTVGGSECCRNSLLPHVTVIYLYGVTSPPNVLMYRAMGSYISCW